MHILLTYATNSGSTGEATTRVANILKKSSHTVTVKEAHETIVQDIASSDVVVFGTPSWDYNGLEGQPHEDISALVDSLKTLDLSDKPYALFSLGDTSYTKFCSAIDVLEPMLDGLKMKRIHTSLKIDKFYGNPKAPEEVDQWASELTQNLNSPTLTVSDK